MRFISLNVAVSFRHRSIGTLKFLMEASVFGKGRVRPRHVSTSRRDSRNYQADWSGVEKARNGCGSFGSLAWLPCDAPRNILEARSNGGSGATTRASKIVSRTT